VGEGKVAPLAEGEGICEKEEEEAIAIGSIALPDLPTLAPLSYLLNRPRGFTYLSDV
jgi:hypothetical protein